MFFQSPSPVFFNGKSLRKFNRKKKLPPNNIQRKRIIKTNDPSKRIGSNKLNFVYSNNFYSFWCKTSMRGMEKPTKTFKLNIFRVLIKFASTLFRFISAFIRNNFFIVVCSSKPPVTTPIKKCAQFQ